MATAGHILLVSHSSWSSLSLWQPFLQKRIFPAADGFGAGLQREVFLKHKTKEQILWVLKQVFRFWWWKVASVRFLRVFQPDGYPQNTWQIFFFFFETSAWGTACFGKCLPSPPFQLHGEPGYWDSKSQHRPIPALGVRLGGCAMDRDEATDGNIAKLPCSGRHWVTQGGWAGRERHHAVIAAPAVCHLMTVYSYDFTCSFLLWLLSEIPLDLRLCLSWASVLPGEVLCFFHVCVRHCHSYLVSVAHEDQTALFSMAIPLFS